VKKDYLSEKRGTHRVGRKNHKKEKKPKEKPGGVKGEKRG